LCLVERDERAERLATPLQCRRSDTLRVTIEPAEEELSEEFGRPS
jgi:hypothetical protein